jgi:hypothetical protein
MNIRSRFLKELASLAVFLTLVSCNLLSSIGSLGPSSSLPTDPPVQLATPVASQPAAGICPEGQGEVVIMRVNPDVPDPRGLEVSIEVSLGELTATIEPGDEYTFDRSLGQILLPGVHFLETSSCCGGEIWLKPDSSSEATVAAETAVIGETALPETQGHLEFPYLSADAGNFNLQAGEEIGITWIDAPIAADTYEIWFISADEVKEVLPIVSNQTTNGVKAVWLVPERVSGRLEGIARYGNEREVRSGCCSQVFTGELPPEGICSLLIHGIGVQNLYQEPNRESLRIMGIAPGIYLEVLERTLDDWYFVQVDQTAGSGESESVSTTGWMDGQENVSLHGTCEDIPITGE